LKHRGYFSENPCKEAKFFLNSCDRVCQTQTNFDFFCELRCSAQEGTVWTGQGQGQQRKIIIWQ
jgi:hypothetical protein